MKSTNKYKLDLGYLVDFDHPSPMITDLKVRFEHTYIIGKTGMGKSSLLERMALYDIGQGIATIFIDPKGDSVKRIYHQIQDKSNVYYISIDSPLVINPLNKEGYRLDNIIQEFVQILDTLVTLGSSNPESTVLMKEIIGMTLKIFKKDEHKNLDYFTKFLLFPEVRKKHIASLIPGTTEYLYWHEFDSKNREKVESAKRVASRLIEISNGEMKDFVIGKNEFDVTELVEQQKVILVDTSRMNRNSRIYLSNLIVYSVLSYCEFAKNKTKPLLVYVDEFQIVVSSLFTELLARSRSSKVGFTLAHQTFHQIPRNILSDIFGTVGTQICFRCGDEEANRFAPIFGTKTKDVFNLAKYHAWLRIGTDNTLFKTYPPVLSEVPAVDVKTQSMQSNASLVVEKLKFPKPKVEAPIQSELSFLKENHTFLTDKWIDMPEADIITQ